MRYQVKIGKPLENGFRFYNQYDASHATHLAGIAVRAGSIHSPPNLVGLPHLVEHVVARESNKHDRKKVELMTAALGGPDGDINIRIDKISTFYGFASLLRLKKMLEYFDLMASLVIDRITTECGIAIEKSAVENEYFLREQDIIPGLLDVWILKTLYEKNPIRMRIDCETDDLEKISLQHVRDFIKKHYVAGNMFAIIMGPSFEEAKELVRHYFGKLPSKPPPTFNYNHSEDFPFLKNMRHSEILRDIGQYHLALAFPTEPSGSKDEEAIDILAGILSFRLYMRLRESNTLPHSGTYRTPVETSRSHVHGLIYPSFATTNKEFTKSGEDAILEELSRLCSDLVHEEEMEAAREYLDNRYLDAFKSTPAILAEMVIESVCNGDDELTELHSFRSRLYKVTRRKLREIANKYFVQNYAKVRIGPKPIA